MERILTSVQSRMPNGLTLHQVPGTGHMVSFRIDPLHKRGAAGLKFREGSALGVRNRDGITPESIAWATWMLLDSLIRSSKRTGMPWPKDAATALQAYAEAVPAGINSWVADGGQFRIDFPTISLHGVAMRPPTAARLPFPLVKRYRLPTWGPITSPGNYRAQARGDRG
jgi:hypothetical protein